MTEFESIQAYQGAEASWQGAAAILYTLVYGGLLLHLRCRVVVHVSDQARGPDERPVVVVRHFRGVG